MTNERVCASDEALPLEPVSRWENEACKGLALVAAPVFRKHLEKANELRDRQKAYLSSLPSDCAEAISSTFKLMHPGGQDYPDGFTEALHLAHGLEALIKKGETDEGDWDHAAALFVASQIVNGLHRCARQLDRVSDILDNPDRIKREKC